MRKKISTIILILLMIACLAAPAFARGGGSHGSFHSSGYRSSGSYSKHSSSSYKSTKSSTSTDAASNKYSTGNYSSNSGTSRTSIPSTRKVARSSSPTIWFVPYYPHRVLVYNAWGVPHYQNAPATWSNVLISIIILGLIILAIFWLIRRFKKRKTPTDNTATEKPDDY